MKVRKIFRKRFAFLLYPSNNALVTSVGSQIQQEIKLQKKYAERQKLECINRFLFEATRCRTKINSYKQNIAS